MNGWLHSFCEDLLPLFSPSSFFHKYFLFPFIFPSTDNFLEVRRRKKTVPIYHFWKNKKCWCLGSEQPCVVFFFVFFKKRLTVGWLTSVVWSGKLLANSSSGMTLFIQKCYFNIVLLLTCRFRYTNKNKVLRVCVCFSD